MEQRHRQRRQIAALATGPSHSGRRRRRVFHLGGHGELGRVDRPVATRERFVSFRQQRLDAACGWPRSFAGFRRACETARGEHRGLPLGSAVPGGHAAGEWGRDNVGRLGARPCLQAVALGAS